MCDFDQTQKIIISVFGKNKGKKSTQKRELKKGNFFPKRTKSATRRRRLSDDDYNDDESFTTIFATRLARPATKDAGLRRGGVECRLATNAFNEAMAASETDANHRFERGVFFFFDDGGVLGREREQCGWGHDKLAFVEI